jgi:FMN phosphatase YigB (HAD superfamily)
MLRKKWNILVDFDGTLHDTEAIFSSKLDGLLGFDGKTLYYIYLFDIHRKMIHKHFPDRHSDTSFLYKLLCDHLKKPYDRDIISSLEECFKEAEKSIVENPQFFKDTPEFLDRAIVGGHQLCLSTGGGNSKEKAETISKFFGKNYFDKVIGEETLNYLKDDPLYYKDALKQLSWESKDVVSIGDSILTDIYPAKLVGIKTVWVNRKKEKGPLESDKNPNYTTKDLISAIDYLESM